MSDDNLLVAGDNLRVLGRAGWRERFRCAYLDPPFNTGRRFAEYIDARSARAWAEEFRATLGAVVPLVRADGVVVCEIDDTELGSLIETGDRMMGRANRVAVVTVVRSAATGHKAQNRGPVNVTDYLVIWARDKAALRLHPLTTPRAGYDDAYRTFLENPDAPLERWSFVPLGRVVALHLGHPTTQRARRAVGAEAFERALGRFALAHARQVVRFAQPRFEAIARAAQAIVVRSRAAPTRVMRLERPGHKDFVVVGGNRVLFLSDKVRVVDGTSCIVEPLTNVWSDIGFQGIAREGGVVFSRNKKPERLMARILSLCTHEGDWVLDPYAGSGTTAAVAHKMGRRWVAIEREPQLFARARGRLDRVVAGSDPTGVTGLFGWAGGGSYRCEMEPCELTA